MHTTHDQVTTFSGNQRPKYFWALALLGLQSPPLLWP